MPRRTSRSEGRPVASLPSTVIVPAFGLITPAMALSRVDLPAPLGPTIAVMAPRWARTLTFSMIGGPPYPAVRPDTSSAAATSAARGAGSVVSVVIGGHLSEIGVNDGLVAAQLLEWRLGDPPPFGHHHHLVGHPLDERKIVLDDDHRGTGADEAEHGRCHALAEHRVDTAHRLVEDHQSRLGHADAPEFEQALLATAEVAGALVAQGEQPEFLEDGARTNQLLAGALLLSTGRAAE